MDYCVLFACSAWRPTTTQQHYMAYLCDYGQLMSAVNLQLHSFQCLHRNPSFSLVFVVSTAFLFSDFPSTNFERDAELSLFKIGPLPTIPDESSLHLFINLYCLSGCF